MRKGQDDFELTDAENQEIEAAMAAHQLPLNMAYDEGHRIAMREQLKGLIRQAERHEERSAQTVKHHPGERQPAEDQKADRRFTRLLLCALRGQF